MIDRRMRWLETRALGVLGITYGLGSNNGDLIQNPEFFEPGEIQSQVTNWSEIETIDYGPDLDVYCCFLDEPDEPFDISVSERELLVQGDLSRLDRESFVLIDVEGNSIPGKADEPVREFNMPFTPHGEDEKDQVCFSVLFEKRVGKLQRKELRFRFHTETLEWTVPFECTNVPLP